MSDTKPMRLPPQHVRAPRMPSVHPTLLGTPTVRPTSSEVPFVASRTRPVTPVMLHEPARFDAASGSPDPVPGYAASDGPPPYESGAFFGGEERYQPGRGERTRLYRRAATAFLGVCALLLIVAGASAAHRRTTTEAPTPVTSGLTTPMPAAPIVDAPAVSATPAPVTLPPIKASKTRSTSTSSATTTSHAAAPQAATANAPFNRVAAAQSLADASRASAACKPAGTPVQTRVRVTFAPDGKVSKADVLDPRYAKTDIGRCVRGKLKSATVPPFQGAPQTVSTVLVP